VDLRTRRPFDLKKGITLSAAAEGVYGDRTKGFDPQVNGLISWRNDRFGALLTASYAKVDLANSYAGIQRDFAGRLANEGIADATGYGGFRFGDPNRGTTIRDASGTIIGVDVNGDGDANDAFFTPQGHAAWNRVTTRERFGLNGSVQAKLLDSLEFVADGFFTNQIQTDQTAGIQLQGVNWQTADYVPGVSRDTGSLVNLGGTNYRFNTVQRYDYTLQNFDSYSDIGVTKSRSYNLNAELRYDNGGAFTAILRGVYGNARQDRDNSYFSVSTSNGSQWFNGIGNYPASLGGDRGFNPLGYQWNTLPATVDYRGQNLAFTLPARLTSQLSNQASYALKTISSENNYRSNSDMSLLRFDTKYKVSDDLNFEAGVRYGERSATYAAFDRAAPFYAGAGASNPAGCFVKWKAFDIRLNASSCNAPDGAGDFYTANLVRPLTDPSVSDNVRAYNLPATGIGPVFTYNPAAMRNVLDFQNSFYPGNQEFSIPGDSYDIDLKQWAGYFQANFSTEIAGFDVRGNGGVRVIDTSFRVRQNISGPGQPYGLANQDVGDIVTRRHFVDVLPAFNLVGDITDKFRVRLAYAKTMTLLDLSQWGGGLSLIYAIDTSFNPPVFRAQSGTSNGEPSLNPWRANNYDLSFEYYLSNSSLLSVGLFKIDVDSFIARSTVLRGGIPDLDGVVRRDVPISTNVQGKGGSIKGIEAGAKLAFDFLPGALGGFGMDANYTYSDSSSNVQDLTGQTLPFQDSSKHQVNAAIWYEKYGFNARVAYNYRSSRVEEFNFGGNSGLTLFQAPTQYVDASIGYDITKNVTIYAQGTNLTGERERYYIGYPDQRLNDSIFERRFLFGVRAKI
jgi:iron complex outermembrane recepter protein